MKILFVLKQRNYLTTFSGAVAALASRGHAVRLAWPDEDVSLPEGLSSPCISVDLWEPKRGDEWAPVVGTVRRAADYLRYLEPEYAAAVKLRARSFEKLLHSLSKGDRVPDAGWSEIGRALTPEERDRLMTVTRLMEQAIPSDAKHEALDRKSTRLNSSHSSISYAVFCLKKKNTRPLIKGSPPAPTEYSLRPPPGC